MCDLVGTIILVVFGCRFQSDATAVAAAAAATTDELSRKGL